MESNKTVSLNACEKLPFQQVYKLPEIIFANLDF